MLRIIKRKESNKVQSLEEAVKNLDKANHMYKGFQNKLKSKEFTG